MNQTINDQLKHRTIREFTDEKIDEATIKTLLDVVNMSASSNGMQNMSIIRVTDPKIKEELAENGNQAYMARASELWIFIVDLKRNYEIAKELGVENDVMISFDKFIQGFTDAIIAAQNLTLAVESLGLGANYFGNIHNDTKKVIKILKMPKLTYPAVGVGFGVPNQDPQIKPRLDINLKTFENSYKTYDSYLEMIKNYDQEMTTYYDLRDAGRKSESFSSQIIKKQGKTIKNRNKMFETLIDQGFVLNPS
ncbi:nitroreductase family protein [uncultured Anaerococcus sp.]|uniref:nitroreductase family protein n=1 Tax=uncultured Anaerococcus sp. TaxID=293428 RepID=UPI00288A86C8|nr:nitroreductase family protein [uncultured Anaerococcus sp.]